MDTLETLKEEFPENTGIVQKVYSQFKGADISYIRRMITNSIKSASRTEEITSIDFRGEKTDHARILSKYLTKRCKCSDKNCLFQHDPDTPLRRCPFIKNGEWSYQPHICMDFDACPNGDNCPLSHSNEEIIYHPLNYKVELCVSFKECQGNSSFCPNAHGEKDKRTPLAKASSSSHSFRKQPRINQSAFGSAPKIGTKTENRKEEESSQTTSLRSSPRPRDNLPILHSVQEKKCEAVPEEDVQVENYEEMSKLINEQEELKKQLSELYEKIDDFKQFLCSVCKMEYGSCVFKCGHLVCSECQVIDICSFCGETLPIQILF